MSKIITSVYGRAVPVDEDDVDTDIISPSESMKTLTWDEVANFLFYMRRHTSDGSPTDHVLNNQSYAGAIIFIAGSSFGCGSSREHAPQAIKRSGFDAIVALSYAGIFDDNCRAIGLPAVTVGSRDELSRLMNHANDPLMMFRVDLDQRVIRYGYGSGLTTGSVPLNISDTTRDAFLNGTWDERDALEERLPQVTKTLNQLPYISGFIG